MAAKAGKKGLGDDAKVHMKVFLGNPEDKEVEGLGICVKIGVEGVDDDAVIAAAHKASLRPSARAYVH